MNFIRSFDTELRSKPSDSLAHRIETLLDGNAAPDLSAPKPQDSAYKPRAELMRQGQIARSLGSPFVAAVLEAGYRQLDRGVFTTALIDGWPGDPAAAGVAMRFNAALHALARRETLGALSALYRREYEDFDHAIAEALTVHDKCIAHAMRYPTQTNEVGRAAAIIAALMTLKNDWDMPFELLELGSSCGLNLNLAHYAYDLGGTSAGMQQSPVQIAPDWQGARLPEAAIEIVAARGADLHPLDVRDIKTAERLMSYIWADQPSRLQRLEKALMIAQAHPPRVDRADAVIWAEEQLRIPQQAGVCRVLFHSMVAQYLGENERKTVEETIRAAGAHADDQHPLAWISFEWTRDRSEVQLLLTCWPSGQTRHLATCHPYGASIHWFG